MHRTIIPHAAGPVKAGNGAGPAAPPRPCVPFYQPVGSNCQARTAPV